MFYDDEDDCEDEIDTEELVRAATKQLEENLIHGLGGFTKEEVVIMALSLRKPPLGVSGAYHKPNPDLKKIFDGIT